LCNAAFTQVRPFNLQPGAGRAARSGSHIYPGRQEIRNQGFCHLQQQAWFFSANNIECHYFYYQRDLSNRRHYPLVYFLLIALFSGVLFLQIISVRPKWTDSLIVRQIIILSLNLIWGATLKYPLYFGDTDLLVH
jgi:hypothetical protein